MPIEKLLDDFFLKNVCGSPLAPLKEGSPPQKKFWEKKCQLTPFFLFRILYLYINEDVCKKLDLKILRIERNTDIER